MAHVGSRDALKGSSRMIASSLARRCWISTDPPKRAELDEHDLGAREDLRVDGPSQIGGRQEAESERPRTTQPILMRQTPRPRGPRHPPQRCQLPGAAGQRPTPRGQRAGATAQRRPRNNDLLQRAHARRQNTCGRKPRAATNAEGRRGSARPDGFRHGTESRGFRPARSSRDRLGRRPTV